MQAFQEGQRDDGYFDRLLDLVGRHGLVAVLEAYLDESERAGRVFGVAGYAFAPAHAKRFTKEWRTLFSGRVCHMTDLVAKRGDFAGIRDAERDALVKGAVKLINKRMAFGVAVSCNPLEVQQLTPAWIEGFGHAYPICCHGAMAAMGLMISNLGLPDRVVYTFESGHDYEAEARRFIASVAIHNSALKEQFRHHGDAFLPKTDAVPLQAADMLVWEWTKCQDESIERQIRPIRQSLRTLYLSAPRRYSVNHLTGEPLAKWLNNVRTIVLQRLRETGQPIPEQAY